MHAWISRKGRGKIWEDEVTSCVFGPLRFFDPQQAWEICLGLFGDRVRQCIPLSAADVKEVDVGFWPRFTTESGYVEPDMRIVAKGHNGSVNTILVEVKWGARLGDNQLLRQWRWLPLPNENNYNANMLRQQTVHVFLYRGRFVDREVFERQKRTNEWGKDPERLIAISWHDLARHADAIQLSGMASAWKQDLLCFLASQGIGVFHGFQSICSTSRIGWILDRFRQPELRAADPLNWSLEKKETRL